MNIDPISSGLKSPPNGDAVSNVPGVKTQLPNAGRWLKNLTSVELNARNGHGYEGTFLNANSQVLLPPGTLIAMSESYTEASILVLLPSGD